MNPHLRKFMIALLVAALIAVGYALVNHQWIREPPRFDGQRAYQHVIQQEQFGPRLPGSDAHAKTVDFIRAELEANGWQVNVQESQHASIPIRNVVAYRGDPTPPILLGAHFDTRIYADQDADESNRLKPVPGANDGASGVAVLIELSRVLSMSNEDVGLVFFDAEDQGGIDGLDWILGSRYFVEQLTYMPDAVIIVDMVGDADQQLYYERNSNQPLMEQIWSIADSLGYGDRFIPQTKYSILDDHTPFLEAGIRAIDIIDFDYPYWHTIADTSDKVSPESLEAVGRTLVAWLISLE